MIDLSRIVRFCEESEVGPFTKKLISLAKLTMHKQGEAMANKRIYYVTESIGITCALKIGDRVKVIENDEGFNKDTWNPSDFKAYRDSIGQEYEVTGIVNLKNKVEIAVSNTRFLYPACIFEKIGEAEQKDKLCDCDRWLVINQGCHCGGK